LLILNETHENVNKQLIMLQKNLPIYIVSQKYLGYKNEKHTTQNPYRVAGI